MFLRAQLSAQMATIADFLVTILLVRLFDVYYVYATLAGAIYGGIVNCVINYKWTFKSKGKKTHIAVKFIIVWICSIWLNTWGTYTLTESLARIPWVRDTLSQYFGDFFTIGEIRRFLRDNNALRVSRSLRDTAYRAMQSRETLEKQLGREPTMDEIAQSAGLTRREVTAALESVVEPISLEEPVYTDGGDAMYVIDQVRDPDGEDSWISGLQFRQTVAGLTPREKRIMELRYLQGKTQMEVAREIGISQAQVSRLEKGALSQFRTRD